MAFRKIVHLWFTIAVTSSEKFIGLALMNFNKYVCVVVVHLIMPIP